jgi:hypothetical protein
MKRNTPSVTTFQTRGNHHSDVGSEEPSDEIDRYPNRVRESFAGERNPSMRSREMRERHPYWREEKEKEEKEKRKKKKKKKKQEQCKGERVVSAEWLLWRRRGVALWWGGHLMRMCGGRRTLQQREREESRRWEREQAVGEGEEREKEEEKKKKKELEKKKKKDAWECVGGGGESRFGVVCQRLAPRCWYTSWCTEHSHSRTESKRREKTEMEMEREKEKKEIEWWPESSHLSPTPAD